MIFPHDMPEEERHRRMEEIREEQRKNIREWCKEHNIPEEKVEYYVKFMTD